MNPFTLLDKLDPNAVRVVGILLILVGFSFGYKFLLASVKGRMKYWSGFLPFTIMSPFILHTPTTSKRTLVRETEGLWIHLLMAPIFLICMALCIGAGADLAGLPGTAAVNWVLSGGKGTEEIVFDRHTGYKFPILARAYPVIEKMMNSKMKVGEKDKLYTDDPGTLGDAMRDGR